MATTVFQPALLASTVEVVNIGRGYRRWSGQEYAPVVAMESYDRTGYEWSYHEGASGARDWTKLDAKIADNWSRGKRTSIMLADMRGGANNTYAGTFVPSDLATAPYGVLSGGAWYVDYNNSTVQSRYDAFVTAVYTRYKSDYRVFSVHVPLGQFGEWYLSSGISGYTYPSMYALKRRIDAYKIFNTGTHIRVVMMTDDEHACRYALKFAGPTTLVRPWGLGRYSLGDVRDDHFNKLDSKYYVGKLYNRIEDATASNPNPGTIRDDAFAIEFRERWKVAPWETEFYGTSGSMGIEPFDEVVRDVQKWHLALIGNGNLPGGSSYYTNLSQTQKDYYLQAGRLAGFRIGLARVEVSTLESGKPFTITTSLLNTGVAPTYDPWIITYQLKSGSTITWEGASAYDLRQLLPDTPITIADTVTLPSIGSGTYTLYVLIKHGQFPTQLSALLLANIGTQSDRSLLLGAVTTGTTGGSVSSQITQVGDPVNSRWSKADLATNGNTIGMTRQAGATTGDLLELVIGVNLGSNSLNAITPTVSGWTLVTSESNPLDVAAFLYRRTILAGDSPTITVSFNASADLICELLAYRGFDGTTPIEVTAVNQSSSPTTAITAPAVTPTSNNGLRQMFAALAYGWNTSTLNANQPMTALFNEVSSSIDMTLLGAVEQLGAAISGVAQPTRGWTAAYAAHYVAISSVLRAASVTALIAPTNVLATPISATQVNISWDAVSGAAQYLVEWASAAAGPWTVLTIASTTSAAHTGLTAGTTRFYRVLARNSPSRSDSSYSATAQATTTGGSTTGLLNPIKTNSGINAAQATSVSFAKPAEATAGREMFVHVFVRNSGTTSQQPVVSGQTGWTNEKTTHENFNIGLHTFRRTLTGNITNEPATLSFNWTTGGTANWAAWAYEIFDNAHSTILDVTPVGSSGGATSTSYSAGTITPTNATFFLYVVGTSYSNNNIVAPTNYTEQQEPKLTGSQITGHVAVWEANSVQQHTPAASGPAAGYVAQVFALRAAAVATVTIPAAPTNLLVSVIGSTANLTWTDAATNETSYRVLLSRDAGLTWETVADALAGGSTSSSITDLPAGAYRAGVEAVNSAGAARTTTTIFSVNASGSGAGGGRGRERLQLAVYDQLGGTLLADWTATASAVRWSNGPRGYQDLTAFIPMSRAAALLWVGRGVCHVEVNAGATRVWEGRLEDVKPVPGGIEIKALGYARALTDILYTAFWSNTRWADWQILDEAFFTDSHPERFQIRLTDSLLITTRTNTSHGTTIIAYVAFSVPDDSRNLITYVTFDYDLAPGTNWQAGLQARDANWQFVGNVWSQYADASFTLSGSQTVVVAPTQRLTFFYRYDAATVAVPDDPGRYYLRIKNLRVKTVSGNVTGNLIVKDVLSAIRVVNPSQISSRTHQIQAPGLDLPDAVWEDTRPVEIADELTLLGDNQQPPRRWDLAVWADQVLSYRPHGAGRIWRIRLAEEPKVERSLDELHNAWYAIHDTRRGDQVRTELNTDVASAKRWGLIRQDVTTVKTIFEAQARTQRDMHLADATRAPARAAMRVAEVYTERGAPAPKYAVRAGDTAILIGLDGAFGDDESFVIANAEYAEAEDDLMLTPDAPLPTVEVEVARAEWGIQ